MKRLLLMLSIVSLFGTACEKKETCLSEEIAVTSLEKEYGCENTVGGLEIDLEDSHTIIRSQPDFEQRVAGDCMPEIDFEKYDLIIGKQRLRSGVHEINYEYLRNCNGDYRLNVSIQHNSASVAPNITYHALVPKLPAGEPVDVDIKLDY